MHNNTLIFLIDLDPAVLAVILAKQHLADAKIPSAQIWGLGSSSKSERQDRRAPEAIDPTGLRLGAAEMQAVLCGFTRDQDGASVSAVCAPETIETEESFSCLQATISK